VIGQREYDFWGHKNRLLARIFFVNAGGPPPATTKRKVLRANMQAPIEKATRCARCSKKIREHGITLCQGRAFTKARTNRAEFPAARS